MKSSRSKYMKYTPRCPRPKHSESLEKPLWNTASQTDSSQFGDEIKKFALKINESTDKVNNAVVPLEMDNKFEKDTKFCLVDTPSSTPNTPRPKNKCTDKSTKISIANAVQPLTSNIIAEPQMPAQELCLVADASAQTLISVRKIYVISSERVKTAAKADTTVVAVKGKSLKSNLFEQLKNPVFTCVVGAVFGVVVSIIYYYI